MKKVWIKSIFLTVSFCLIVSVIYKLRSTEGLTDSLGLIFYGVESENQVDWCNTRVTEIDVPGRVRVFQEGLKWYREFPGQNVVRELGFVPVEKWFSSHCRLTAEGKTEGLITELAGPEEKTLATVSFVNGKSETFKEIAEGIFTWSNITFRSEELKPALNGLEQLPEIGGSDIGKAPGH